MKTIWISVRMLVVLSILTGLIYPFLMTGLAQAFFSSNANGSMIVANGKTIGSTLVGQNFTSDKYFWSRPSAVAYNPLPSSGTNQGPTNAILKDSVVARANRLGGSPASLPPDLLLSSGSGLDPHISPEAALFQIDRVTAARGGNRADRDRIEALVKSHIELPQFNLFGEERVNVLKLNLALDSLLER